MYTSKFPSATALEVGIGNHFGFQHYGFPTTGLRRRRLPPTGFRRRGLPPTGSWLRGLTRGAEFRRYGRGLPALGFRWRGAAEFRRSRIFFDREAGEVFGLVDGPLRGSTPGWLSVVFVATKQLYCHYVCRSVLSLLFAL